MTTFNCSLPLYESRNLHTLLETENVSNLEVIYENGHRVLQSRTGLLAYLWRWKKPDEKVAWECAHLLKEMSQNQTVLGELNQKITNRIIPQSNSAQTYLQVLFFERFKQLQSDYNELLDYKTYITKDVQNALSPDVQECRKHKSRMAGLKQSIRDCENANQDPQKLLKETIAEVETHALKSRIAKAKLTLNLGTQPLGSKGATGTVILKFVNGKKLGVFKPGSAYANLSIRIKNFFKRWFFGQLYYLHRDPLAQPKAEVINYLFDRHFNFNRMSPPSQLVTLEERQGAFQLFLQETEFLEASDPDLQHFLEMMTGDSKQDFPLLSPFQLMTIYDLLLMQLDRHLGNWGFNKSTFTHIRLIDNANSLIERHPNRWTKWLLRHQYEWKKFPLAQIPFRPDIRNFILNTLTDEAVRDFIQDLKKSSDFSSFLNTDIEHNILRQLTMLRRAALNRNASPATLAELRTEQEINAYINSHLDSSSPRKA